MIKSACNNLQRLSKKTLLSILPSYYDTTYILDTLTGKEVRIDSLNSGPIIKIQVIDPGQGYTSIPSVTISGGGGSGATAVAVIVDEKINRIDITNVGKGYIKPPEVIINGENGSGAYAISYLKDLTYILKNGILSGKYERIEKFYPRKILLKNDNWTIKSFNYITKEVCILFDNNNTLSYTIP